MYFVFVFVFVFVFELDILHQLTAILHISFTQPGNRPKCDVVEGCMQTPEFMTKDFALFFPRNFSGAVLPSGNDS
jgi:hypothetical protein